MNYFKWLLTTGWKKYLASFIILIVVDYGFASSYNELKFDPFWLVAGAFILGGATLGLIYHTYATFKVEQENP